MTPFEANGTSVKANGKKCKVEMTEKGLTLNLQGKKTLQILV